MTVQSWIKTADIDAAVLAAFAAHHNWVTSRDVRRILVPWHGAQHALWSSTKAASIQRLVKDGKLLKRDSRYGQVEYATPEKAELWAEIERIETLARNEAVQRSQEIDVERTALYNRLAKFGGESDYPGGGKYVHISFKQAEKILALLETQP